MNRSPPEPSYICTMESSDTLTFLHMYHIHQKRKKDADVIMSEYNEEIGSDQGIGMDQILREAEHDTASWEKNDMPGTETLGRLQDVLLREGRQFRRYRAETSHSGAYRAALSASRPARQASPAQTDRGETAAASVAPEQRR